MDKWLVHYRPDYLHILILISLLILYVAPGFVQSGWTCHYSILFRMLMQVIMWMFFVPCELGAQTVIYCAVSDEAAKRSGGYFVDCRPATPRPFARDAGVAKKLWEASERLVKLA